MKKRVVLTGPGVERSYPSVGVASSAALTRANVQALAGVESSFYVRDEDDVVLARADSDAEGRVFLYSGKSLEVSRGG